MHCNSPAAADKNSKDPIDDVTTNESCQRLLTVAARAVIDRTSLIPNPSYRPSSPSFEQNVERLSKRTYVITGSYIFFCSGVDTTAVLNVVRQTYFYTICDQVKKAL